jgi:hypothetical protein
MLNTGTNFKCVHPMHHWPFLSNWELTWLLICMLFALSHFSGPPTTSEVSCASSEFPTATLLVLLSGDGVAYSFWKLDVGEGSPLRVNYFVPGEMTHRYCAEDYVGYRDCPGIVGGKNIQLLTRIRS